MANALIKVNIIIYQIVSTFLLLYILSSMIYYTYIQRKKSLFVKHKKNIVPICYDIYNNNSSLSSEAFEASNIELLEGLEGVRKRPAMCE